MGDYDDRDPRELDSLVEGYECATCGHTPTRHELDRGSCPRCARDRVAARKAATAPVAS
jgi:predicted Zn-ribbon and HTH transcriptional regulator